MKKYKKLIAVLIFCVLIICSFFGGRYSKEREYKEKRLQQCQTLISFAIDKIDNKDLSDPGVMKALISNIYGAYELCDNSNLANELHNLWNELIFESENNLNITNTTKKNLEIILEKLKTNNNQ